MADGLKIELEAPLAERVKKLAAEGGVSVNEVVGRSLEAWLDDWAEDIRRLEEPGASIPAEQVFAEIDARFAPSIDSAETSR